ncbi:hypothetical protein [Sporolituus thermophilus]|uniref:Uncharacterized protein n=1 Tax=Sporolituus thermophilus DSM 23256 TaxID=1123285 RepID=A0A1G7NLM4_9FIRM|nr:hypothetical protein [Sporolituus thermophilus]SDF74913.1 hypothetical protein SAMN05660235_02619 [Sporolituus thermophilus DSM 23256]
MLVRLSLADAKVILRGLLVMLAVIIAGVSAAEYQMNNMTQHRNFVQVVNVRRENGGYGVYLFGQAAKFSALYPVGKIKSTGGEIIFEYNSTRLTLPTVVYLDLNETVYWLKTWRDQFVAEAIKTKRDLEKYAATLRPYLTLAGQLMREWRDRLAGLLKPLSGFSPPGEGG